MIPTNRFILEAIIIVWINPLFTTIWKYGHAHLVVVFVPKFPKKHLSLDLYHIYKKKSVAQVCWAKNSWCMGWWRASTRPPFQCIVS